MRDIQLNRHQPTEVSFELELDGLEVQASNIDVRFGIECNSYNLTVTAISAGGAEYTLTMPSLSFFGESITGCKYFIEVVVGDYYFKPVVGMVEIVNDSAESNFNINKTLAPAVDDATTNVHPPAAEPVTSDAQPSPIEDNSTADVSDDIPTPEEIPFAFKDSLRTYAEIDLDSLPKGVDNTTDVTPTEEPSQEEPVEPEEPKVEEPVEPVEPEEPVNKFKQSRNEPMTDEKKEKLRNILKAKQDEDKKRIQEKLDAEREAERLIAEKKAEKNAAVKKMLEQHKKH
jgi:hypothetical protein